MLGHELEMKRVPERVFARKRISVFTRLIVPIAFVTLLLVLLSHAGSFLVLNAPKHSDVILVLGGVDDSPYWHAVKLQKQGYGDRILLNANIRGMIFGESEADLAAEFLRRTSPTLTEVCPTVQYSSFDEVSDVQGCLARLNVSSVLIVTSDFHTRLALSIFQKRLPQYSWSVAAASFPYHDADRWWKHRTWAKTVLDEWEQLAWWEFVDRWRPDAVLGKEGNRALPQGGRLATIERYDLCSKSSSSKRARPGSSKMVPVYCRYYAEARRDNPGSRRHQEEQWDPVERIQQGPILQARNQPDKNKEAHNVRQHHHNRGVLERWIRTGEWDLAEPKEQDLRQNERK